MIVLEGRVYQARADGSVRLVPDSLTTPFATVTYFGRDFALPTDETMNYSAFAIGMAERLPTENMVYAVRMHGTFPSMKVRAIPAQQKPYPTLSEAAANQSVYTYENATGSVVGCSCPCFLKDSMWWDTTSTSSAMTGRRRPYPDFTVPAGMEVEYDTTPGFTMVFPQAGISPRSISPGT